MAHVAVDLAISRATGYEWPARWRAEGAVGPIDGSGRARRLPGKTSAELERQVLALRARRKLGPARIAPLVGLAPSTVHAVLRQHGLHRPAWLDRPTGASVRRYERARPGELVHVVVKKLGRIREGGGCMAAARPSTTTVAPRSRRAAERAMSTCTPRSMTTPGLPTPRSIPTRPLPPAPASSARPRPSSPPSASTGSSG